MESSSLPIKVHCFSPLLLTSNQNLWHYFFSWLNCNSSSSTWVYVWGYNSAICIASIYIHTPKTIIINTNMKYNDKNELAIINRTILNKTIIQISLVKINMKNKQEITHWHNTSCRYTLACDIVTTQNKNLLMENPLIKQKNNDTRTLHTTPYIDISCHIISHIYLHYFPSISIPF